MHTTTPDACTHHDIYNDNTVLQSTNEEILKDDSYECCVIVSFFIKDHDSEYWWWALSIGADFMKNENHCVVMFTHVSNLLFESIT